MRRNHGSTADGYCVVKRFIGDVGDVHHHAQAVHFQDHLLAEIGQAIVMFDFGVGDIAGGIRPFVSVGPSECHVAHTETVEIV